MLNTPETWAESRAGRVTVPRTSPEYKKVVEYFTHALHGQRNKVRVVAVERIQNTPLYQSYAVKKQTMKARDAENPDGVVNNREIERQWLFHGTKAEIVPIIVNQGFNRSFAGRNAVVFGRGVYFARDASYSSHPSFSEPDEDKIQRMFMCRVAVGDWCRGTNGQITPGHKPKNPLELFDSTVDNVDKPSIFVVYHDSQAYPEYLVSFTRP